MATDWVMDASIAVKLLQREQDSQTVIAFLAGLEDLRLLAPALLRYEVGQVCIRNKQTGIEEKLLDLGNVVDTVEPDDVAAHASSLSYYDAAYLALAIEQKAGLLTADDKLRKAAKKRGIPVGP